MKKEIREIVLQVMELYLLASEPLFLFISLRNLFSIKTLSDKYSTDKLMNFYSKEETNKDIDGQCLYYIILIALSFKPYGEVQQYLKNLSKEKYMWAKELGSIVLSNIPNVQVEPVIFEKQVEIDKESVEEHTSVSQEIETTNKPVIQQHPDSLKDVIADFTTINFEDKKNEN